MKRKLLFLAGIFLFAIGLSSCNSLRDCQGVKHTRLSNGVRI